MKKIMLTAALLLMTALVTKAQPGYISSGEANGWVNSRMWAPEGLAVSPQDEVNADEFYLQYQKNKAVWDAVFAYMRDTDFNTFDLSVGQVEIVPGCILKTSTSSTREEAETPRFENHHRVIDLQYTFGGVERIGVPTGETTLTVPYDAAKDVEFYTCQKREIFYYTTSPATFYLFFPGDLHMPTLKAGEIQPLRKVTFKIDYVE